MDFKVIDLGLIDYKSALSLQKETLLKVRSGSGYSTLFICSHYPVITRGRRALKENLLISQEDLKERAIAFYEAERGGDITYHGPGQLTAYPIFDLNKDKKDIHLFLRNLEECAIGFLAGLDIEAERKKGFTGAWIGEKKIASIGIAIRNWITFHGLTINIKRDDLENFRLIRPCGMDVEMVSCEELCGRGLDMAEMKIKLAESFKEVFCAEEAALWGR